MSPENSKPEWFQLADADAIPPQPKSKRVIRIMALASPLLVLGAGLVFAQSQDSPTAVASAVATPGATTPAPTTTDPTSPSTSPITVSTPTASSTPVSGTVEVSQTSPATQSASATLRKPAIATMPTGSGEDDGLRTSDDD